MKIIVFCFLIMFILSSCQSNNIINKEMFDSIEYGMSKDEVKNILGEPADVRAAVGIDSNYFYYREKGVFSTRYSIIEFDKSERVRSKYFENPE